MDGEELDNHHSGEHRHPVKSSARDQQYDVHHIDLPCLPLGCYTKPNWVVEKIRRFNVFPWSPPPPAGVAKRHIAL